MLCNCKALFNRALIVVNAVERHFDCDRIVLSACLANFLDDLSEKALAVSKLPPYSASVRWFPRR